MDSESEGGRKPSTGAVGHPGSTPDCSTPLSSDDGRKGGRISAQASKFLPMLEAETERRAPALRPLFQFLTPVLVWLCEALDAAGPYILMACRVLYVWYKGASSEVIYALVGLALCFFGGSFVATIAAVEAFKLYGWDTCHAQMRCLWADYRIMRARARRKAIEEGRQPAGFPNVEQVFADDITISQRIAMFGACIRDPEKLSKALTGLYTGLLGVITTLRVQFARTIALGASIAGMVHERIEPHVLPHIKQVMKPEHQQWAPTLLQWICHFVAISLAWQVQMIISAVQSAMRGGLMFSRHAFRFARRRKWKVPPEGTWWDDVVGYSVAAAGLYAQLRMSFRVPFPLNIILLPVSALEWWLHWFM
eukprot:Hpha_TRINITY_DN13755_c1_g1::TRINITY_DN13755_c1_g1_i1::g.142487::m.142487